MRCVDCRFSLVCYAGRLDARDEGEVDVLCFCPACARIVLFQNDHYYAFKCEQRPLTSEILQRWKKRRREAHNKTVLMQFLEPDHGPGLMRHLLVRECLDCAPGTFRNHLTLEEGLIDLDEEAALDRELSPNPLGLRHG